jgi:putative ABC transport system substrate-binding protein
MRRRGFMLSSGAAAAGWPRLSGAAPVGHVRRLKVLSAIPRNDPQAELLFAVLYERLRQAGWVRGRNLDVEFHWSGSDVARASQLATDLAQTKPEAFLAVGASALAAAQQATRIVPVIFTLLGEPVDLEALAHLAGPGSNLAGIADFESAPVDRWMELLTACAPHLRRVALIASTRAVGIRLGSASLPVVPIEAHGIEVIINAIERFAGEPDAGLAILPSGFDAAHLDAISAVAAHHRLPSVSSDRRFARCGGLISYGANTVEIYKRVALYIDRILRGTTPSQLEVGRPTVFDLVVNRRTAKALGLHVPLSIIAGADEVIG